jgi:hypothetical protein
MFEFDVADFEPRIIVNASTLDATISSRLTAF